MSATHGALRCLTTVRALFLLGLVACDQGTPRKVAPPPTPVAPKDAASVDAPIRAVVDCPARKLEPSKPADMLAALERTGCLGMCPGYQVIVYRDGRVEYVGTRAVSVCAATDQLDAKQLAALRDLFESRKFLALKDKYTDVDWTDSSSAELVYQPTPGTLKRIEHYHGDEDAPKVLDEIEDGFDRIVDVYRWLPTPE